MFAGSFKPWHGLDVLLEAFATAVRAGADLELELLGDGPGRQAAIERSAALGIAALTAFPGALPHEAIPARLLAAEIAVAPAPANAPPYLSALKLREYAAAGCAIIAASLPQVSGQFRHGHDALLVAPGDTDALAGAIASLARDAPLRRRLGDAAAARAAEFDWAHVALRLREWMEVLAHERTRP